jgi:uncharacterized ferritin-like protein (DUF455 family)
MVLLPMKLVVSRLCYLGISYGSLECMNNHEELWEMGSFVKHDRLGKSNVARKGNDI